MKTALGDKFGACNRHEDKLCRPVSAKPCGPGGSRCFPHRGVRFAQLNTQPALARLFVLHALLIPFDNYIL